MSFVVKECRKVTINHVDGDTEISVTFDFPVAEDRDVAKLKNKLDGTDNGTSATLLYILRSALVSCTGIILETEDGTQKEAVIDNENTQKVIFNAVWMIEDIRNKILMAFGDLEGKNLQTGATEQ